MRRCGILLLFSLPLWLFSAAALSAEPRHSPSPGEQARTLILLNQPVVMLQATFGLTTPEERVKRIVSTLRELTPEDLRHPIETRQVTRYQQPAVMFSIHGKSFMLLAQQDLDEGDDLTLSQAAARVLARLEALQTALAEQYSPHYLGLSALKSVAGLAGLVIVMLLLLRLRRRVFRFYPARKATAGVTLRRLTGTLALHLVSVALVLLSLSLIWLWLSWVLRLFPWTRIWGMELGSYTFSLLERTGVAIVTALPGLSVVLVIFSLTALLLRLLRLVLQRVESGNLQLPGLHPETVGVTRRLLSVAVWLFALSAAYPFLPGAESLAFKGISVFLGLLLTLGSAGVMNHAMSGLVLTYSRALRRGDVIRVADHEGVVSEVGMLATKLQTRENYEITIPNAVVVSGKIVNLSAQSRGQGINMTTSVTIGYDTPWRQVHALLELAASRTQGISRSVACQVRQLALMDWYIAYELQVQIPAGASLAAIRSELHGHIQDVFSEFGVQIMSPNFVSQPEENVLVKPDAWFPPPVKR